MFLCLNLIQKLIAQFHWAPIALQGGEHITVSRQERQWEVHRGTVQITTVSTVIFKQVPTARVPLTLDSLKCASVGCFGPIKNNLMYQPEQWLELEPGSHFSLCYRLKSCVYPMCWTSNRSCPARMNSGQQLIL